MPAMTLCTLPGAHRARILPCCSFAARARALLCLLLLSWGVALGDALQDIRNSGQLRVGVLDTAQPYSFRRADGTRVGLEPDLAGDIANLLGVRLQLVPVDTTNRIETLRAGGVDLLIAGVSQSTALARVVELIRPGYYASGSNVLVRKSERVRAWQDLAGVQACAIRGAPHNRRIRGDFGAELTTYRAVTEAYDALVAGTCRAFVYNDAAIAVELASDARWADYEMPLDTLDETPWALVIRTGEPVLRALLTGITLEWHRDGRLLELEDKWQLRRTPYVVLAREIYQ